MSEPEPDKRDQAGNDTGFGSDPASLKKLRRLVRFGTQHARSSGVDWWTHALQYLATQEAGETRRYKSFIQKWLILVTLDEFLDQDIIPHEDFASWSLASAMYGDAYTYASANPTSLKPPC